MWRPRPRVEGFERGASWGPPRGPRELSQGGQMRKVPCIFYAGKAKDPLQLLQQKARGHLCVSSSRSRDTSREALQVIQVSVYAPRSRRSSSNWHS